MEEKWNEEVSTIIHRILETGALLIVDVMDIGTELGIPI